MRSAAVRWSPLLLLAIAWEVAARSGLASGLALPPLTDVAAAWARLLRDGDLWSNGAASLARLAAGLGLAVAVGAPLGVLMAWSRPLRSVVKPLVELGYPVPKSALIPVTALWLGFGDASKILLIFLGCMLPIVTGAFNGARSAETMLLWSARGLGASRAAALWDVVVPSALPELLGGIRAALAISFVLLVSSELIAARNGLGHLIGFLGEGGVYDAMFAAVLTVASLGFLADRAWLRLARRIAPWQG